MKEFCSNCGSVMNYSLKKISRFRSSTGERLFVIKSSCPKRAFYNLCGYNILGASVFNDGFFASTWYDETYTEKEGLLKISQLEE